MNHAEARDYIARLDALAEHRSAPFADGRMMKWRFFGQGEPLVLIHGGHGSWLHWICNIEALARHRRLILADLPGFGDSDDVPKGIGAQEISEFALASLDALLDGRPLIDMAGFSFGGSIAARIAEKRGNVHRLALLGSAGSATPQLPAPELVRWRQLEGEAQEDALRHNLIARMLHAHAKVEPLVYEAYALATTICRYHSRGEVQRRRLQDILADVRSPVLFMWGEKDATATPEATRYLAQTGPNRAVKVIPGVGHWVQAEAPALINAELERWFSETPVDAVA
jgi:pimeloyl-ACP methyl ester carboxylesterase